MASKVCSLFFKPNSSDSTQNDSSTDKVAKKINYWAVASAIFLITGAAATTVGVIIISKIILVSGITSLALSILASVKALKVNSSAQDESKESGTSGVDTSKKSDLTDPTIQKKFHRSVVLGRVKDVEELIKKGADVNTPNGEGETPLILATRKGDTRIMEIVIANGADVDKAFETSRFDKGITALMEAAEDNNSEAIKILIEKGKALVDKTDKYSENPILGGLMYNRTALMRAVEFNNAKAVEALIECGADMEGKYDKINRWTPLFEATTHGFTETAIVLIKNGAKLNERDSSGWTALMWAASMKHPLIVKELIKQGADKTLKHPGGETALDLAKAGNHFEIVGILEGKE